MTVKRLLTYSLAFAILAAATMPGAGSSARLGPSLSTDAMGEVIVACFALDAADSQADINADRSVDILDLQGLIAEATKTPAPGRESSEGSAPESTKPKGTRLNFPASYSETLTFYVQGESLRGKWRGFMDSVSKFPGESERNRYSLAPHAPPPRA